VEIDFSVIILLHKEFKHKEK